MLGKEYIVWIKKWVNSHNIQYLDVRLEIIDHIASGAEATLQSGDDRHINDIVRGEMNKWPVDKLNQLIKTKRHELRKVWQRRMLEYSKEYFKMPKIIILIGLSTGIYYLLMSQSNLDSSIEMINSIALWIVFLVTFYTPFKAYMSSTDWNQLLTIESYDKTIPTLPMIPYVVSIAITSLKKELSQTDIILYSIGLSISLILVHAFLIVFPKILKKDILQYYKHLEPTAA